MEESPATSDHWVLTKLVDALRLLALPAQEQIAVLPAFVATADEVALTFDEAFRLVGERVYQHVVSEDQQAALREIDGMLESMSVPPAGASDWTPEAIATSVWSRDALTADERWALLRIRALDLLQALGADPGPPDLSGSTYVSADGDLVSGGEAHP